MEAVQNDLNHHTVMEKLGASSSHPDDPTVKNSLFIAVRLTNNADIEKYQYSGFGIRFDTKSAFSFPAVGFGQNIILFGVDMSSSVHVDSKKKNISILGKGPTQGLEHTLTDCR